MKDRIPLSELLTSAIERTGYDASLLVEFMGRRKLANLRKLVEMARQFEQDVLLTLKDFAARLQTSVLEETDEEFATTQPESGNVIRLMSIHQSKGLEFPVVIVADVDRKAPPRRGEAVLHPEHGPLIKPPEQFGDRAENLALRMHTITEQEADAEETIRLFYVACTRAADYLILSTGREEGQASNSPWMKLIESRFDVQTGLLKGDALLGLSEFGTGGRETVPDVYVHRVPCKAQHAVSKHEKRVSPGDLPTTVIKAEPGEFPTSASIYHRDAEDLSRISVSRLEAIDQELKGISHPNRSPNLKDAIDDVVDFDMSTSLGLIVHDVLEKIDFKNHDSWTDLLLTAANLSHEAAKEEVVNRADAMLTRFFHSPITDELAQAKSIHREIDFLLPWPPGETVKPSGISNSSIQQTFISGVIDLLFETDAGWHIFDYKTGEFPLNTPEDEMLSAYELQLGIYAHAVEKWFGVTPKELSLIVFRPTVRRITLPWSNLRWEQIRTRVDRVLESLRGV